MPVFGEKRSVVGVLLRVLLGNEPAPPPGNDSYNKWDDLLIIIAFIMSTVVVLTVLQRLYEHMYHFTPPYLQAYQQLMEARGLMQRGALEFDDQQQSGPFTSVPAGPGGGGGEGEGAAGPSGTTHEIVEVEDPGMHLSAEVLSRLDQDLRTSSFRERERLSAALRADLPPGRSFFFPIRSNSSRTVLPPEFDLSLNDSLNRVSQSARFTRVIVSPSPSSSANAWGGDGFFPQGRSFRFDPRSHSSRTLLPSESNLHLNRTSQSARFNYVNRASQSAGASPSTSRPGSYRWTTNRAPLASNPPPNRAEFQ